MFSAVVNFIEEKTVFNSCINPLSFLTVLDTQSFLFNNSYGTFGFPWIPTVMNPPAIRETWVQNLGWEECLEEVMAIHFSILAWGIPWMEEPGGLQSMVLQ